MLKPEDLNIIVKVKFGSHLYGTDTADSDTDYKGVYMPTMQEILLNRIPKSIRFDSNKSGEKNEAHDVDMEFYSLHYFIKLACEGQTVALDMLHAPDNMLEKNSRIWDSLTALREGFYTRRLDAFVGYARKQASKYGIKGSRLADADKVKDFLTEKIKEHNAYKYSIKVTLTDVWEALPTGEHIHKYEADGVRTNHERMYEVCGRKINEGGHLLYALDIISKFHASYGQRARDARDNKNIDWKAISHALRAGYQCRSIFTKGTIEYPLPEAEYLKQVKAGKLDYTTEVAPHLEMVMDSLERLSEESEYPDKVDKEYWDAWLYKTICEFAFSQRTR